MTNEQRFEERAMELLRKHRGRESSGRWWCSECEIRIDSLEVKERGRFDLPVCPLCGTGLE